jgi:hypothetical protein
VHNLLYLQCGSITTSAKGGIGNSGNIIIGPQFVVLDHSVIHADAVRGHGGNVQVQFNQLLKTAGSDISLEPGASWP